VDVLLHLDSHLVRSDLSPVSFLVMSVYQLGLGLNMPSSNTLPTTLRILVKVCADRALQRACEVEPAIAPMLQISSHVLHTQNHRRRPVNDKFVNVATRQVMPRHHVFSALDSTAVKLPTQVWLTQSTSSLRAASRVVAPITLSDSQTHKLLLITELTSHLWSQPLFILQLLLSVAPRLWTPLLLMLSGKLASRIWSRTLLILQLLLSVAPRLWTPLLLTLSGKRNVSATMKSTSSGMPELGAHIRWFLTLETDGHHQVPTNSLTALRHR
jgi:hypothetical protein